MATDATLTTQQSADPIVGYELERTTIVHRRKIVLLHFIEQTQSGKDGQIREVMVTEEKYQACLASFCQLAPKKKLVTFCITEGLLQGVTAV